MKHHHSTRMLRRKAAARYLTEVRGLPIAPQTLAKIASIGGGPAFRKFGRFPVYDVADPPTSRRRIDVGSILVWDDANLLPSRTNARPASQRSSGWELHSATVWELYMPTNG